VSRGISECAARPSAVTTRALVCACLQEERHSCTMLLKQRVAGPHQPTDQPINQPTNDCHGHGHGQVDNEPNLCYEWFCATAEASPLGYETSAAEYAHFYSQVADVLHAVGDTRIRVAPAGLSPGGTVECGCCGQANCPGDKPGVTGLQFMQVRGWDRRWWWSMCGVLDAATVCLLGRSRHV
jgi:hypothetical protein